jgi:hypothetical protein
MGEKAMIFSAGELPKRFPVAREYIATIYLSITYKLVAQRFSINYFLYNSLTLGIPVPSTSSGTGASTAVNITQPDLILSLPPLHVCHSLQTTSVPRIFVL